MRSYKLLPKVIDLVLKFISSYSNVEFVMIAYKHLFFDVKYCVNNIILTILYNLFIRSLELIVY
jgi:hypothetical protein